jgi:RNA polymerase sigma-70 factor (ECF subfamily)
MESRQTLDPTVWVEQHGDYLFRYALLRLRDPDLAETLVQETFLAALNSQEKFAGRSSERTWLVGILKHKIIDHFRRSSRERQEEEFFNERGYWKVEPTDWGIDPSTLVENQEFWRTLKHCVSELPPRTANAFLWREVDGLRSEEICKALDISAPNLWVMLHRARLHLRQCIEEHWLGQKSHR